MRRMSGEGQPETEVQGAAQEEADAAEPRSQANAAEALLQPLLHKNQRIINRSTRFVLSS